MSNKITIRCVVACFNEEGEPDFFFVKLRATPEQIEHRLHWVAADDAANRAGYATCPFGSPVYCEGEFPGFKEGLENLFAWDSADTVDA